MGSIDCWAVPSSGCSKERTPVLSGFHRALDVLRNNRSNAQGGS